MTTDPVRIKRARVARWTLIANRIGYILLAFAVVAFVMAFLFGFSPTMGRIITTLLLASFVLLAPTIVLALAIKAAERDDRQQGR